MQHYFKLLLLAFAILMNVSMAAADTIGYVHMQRVFNEYKETKVAEEKFKKQQEKFKKEFDKRLEKLEKAKEKGKSEQEIADLTKKLEEELMPRKEELMQVHQQLMTQIRRDIDTAIKGVAQTYGIDVVLNKEVLFQGPAGPIGNEPVILHGGFDMTNFVIEKLNK